MHDNPAFNGRVEPLSVNSLSLQVYEDLNMHVHSVRLRFSQPGGAASRVVVEGVDQGGRNAMMRRETFVDREIVDLDFEFPESPDPSEARYWYEPLSIDITIINGNISPDAPAIDWRLETTISTAAGPRQQR